MSRAGASRQSRSSSGSFAPWVLAVLGTIAIVCVYGSVGGAGFLWDDDAHVTANPAMLGAHGLKEIWTSAKANYCPLTMTSFWMQHALWGLTPGPYHWVSVGFHVGCAGLLWLVLKRLAVPGAWLGAMLWALHPVQAESVAWISELKNTQSGFFYLLSIWFFLRWLETKPAVNRDYVLAAFTALLAILSKSSTVMLPVVLGMIGWWKGWRDWRNLRWLAPFFIVSLVASGWTIWEQKVNSMASGPEWGHGLLPRFAIAGKVFWFYLGKLAWPELVFIYPRWDPQTFGLIEWLPVVAALVLAGVIWWRREALGRSTTLALGYFAVSLFPVLGFFDVFFFRYSFVGDHFQYLASMGPLALVGAGIGKLETRAPAMFASWAVRVGVVALAALSLMTRSQARIYQSNFALWHDTVARNPGAWIARVNLGHELEARGRLDLALSHYEAAVGMKPQFTEVEVNFGNALLQLGRATEAIPHFERAIQGGRGVAEAHNGMGLSLATVGRSQEAIQHYESALKLRKDYLEARFNLGNTYFALGRKSEAAEAWRALTVSAPGFDRAHANLGAALLDLGQIAAAVSELEIAIRLNPRDIATWSNLALAHASVGSFEAAFRVIDQALTLQPDSKLAQETRGRLTSMLAARQRAP